jgi:hypothetical protein
LAALTIPAGAIEIVTNGLVVFTNVPEPSTIILAALGGWGLLVVRRCQAAR